MRLFLKRSKKEMGPVSAHTEQTKKQDIKLGVESPEERPYLLLRAQVSMIDEFPNAWKLKTGKESLKVEKKE